MVLLAAQSSIVSSAGGTWAVSAMAAALKTNVNLKTVTLILMCTMAVKGL